MNGPEPLQQLLRSRSLLETYISLSSYLSAINNSMCVRRFIVVLALIACFVALASAEECYQDNSYRPHAVMTWGFDGFKDKAPGSSSLAGWLTVNAITGESLEQTRQEALLWYQERYGFNNTVLSYDSASGVSVLPQGIMLPVYLTAQGDYGLWAESPGGVVGQKCASIAVIEWVLFISESMAGSTYNGTYGDWYRVRDPAGSRISVGDVVSIGRYLINSTTKRNEEPLVLTFKTWYPVRLDPEHTYRVDNIIHHPQLGWGYGQSNYRYYPSANAVAVWSVEIRNVVKFPWIEKPPIAPGN